MTLYPRALTVALLAGLLGLPATAQSDRDFDPFDDVDQDELNQSIVAPARVAPYISGSYGIFDGFSPQSNDIFNSTEEFEFFIDGGESYTGAIGARIGPTRLEFETGFLDTEFDSYNTPTFRRDLDGDLTYLIFSGNVYYDFDLPVPGLNLYLGAGLGFAHVRAEGDLDPPINFINTSTGLIVNTLDDVDNTFNLFTYQFLAGLSYQIHPNVALTGGYRIRLFSEGGGNDFNNNNFEFKEHEIQIFEVGLRITF